MSTYPSIFDLIPVPTSAPARSFCRHLRGETDVYFIDAYEPDSEGRFRSRLIWLGHSEGVGMLVMQWLAIRGYESVNGGRALYA